jgi:hypothetical protein
MKKLIGIFTGIFICLMLSGQDQSDFVPLKELFKKDFLIGVAVNGRTIAGDAGKMVVENFNTLTCENEMKPQSLLYFPRRNPMGAPQPQGQDSLLRPRVDSLLRERVDSLRRHLSSTLLTGSYLTGRPPTV